VGRQWQTGEGELKEGPLYGDGAQSHRPQRAVPGPLHPSPGEPADNETPGAPSRHGIGGSGGRAWDSAF